MATISVADALLAALGSGSGAEYFTYPGAWMMGPAWSQFPALEAEARRLFRSARLWHQPGFLDADGAVCDAARWRARRLPNQRSLRRL